MSAVDFIDSVGFIGFVHLHLFNMDNEDGNNENAHRAALRYVKNMRKEIRNLVDPLRTPDTLFRQTFRLTKPLFRLLMRDITPYLPQCHSPLAVPNDIKVLSVLQFYATGSYQAPTSSSWLTCLGRSTVGHFIREVTNALNEPTVQRRWIRFPQTRAQRDSLKRRHEQEFKIPGVIGFVDCTELSIYCPPQDMNPQSFWTRKNHYALNVQVVCDSNYVIMNVNAAFPGACGDAFIWRHTALQRKMREAFEDDQSSWLLGDSAYPSEPWMLTPINDAEDGTPERHYTDCHCRARCCVERCFGCLKCRFRCLLRERVLHYHPVMCGKIFKAVCALHNMCRRARLLDEDLEPAPGEEEPLFYVARNEGEVVAMEAAQDDLEAELQIHGEDDQATLAVGQLVRRRIVDYLQIRRIEEMQVPQ